MLAGECCLVMEMLMKMLEVLMKMLGAEEILATD